MLLAGSPTGMGFTGSEEYEYSDEDAVAARTAVANKITAPGLATGTLLLC